MSLSMDFGTCNSVIARRNEGDGRIDVVHLAGLSQKYPYRPSPGEEEKTSSVVPSLIHYGENNHTLLGAQVISEGELDHDATFRWIKLDMLRDNNKFRRVRERRISFRQAADDLLSRLITFAMGSVETAEEKLVLTVPVESFDHYVDWLQGVAASVFNGDIRILDEATACILGYQNSVRDGNIYSVFDFGGGTLDISIVRVHFQAAGNQKCVVLGRAGEELGGKNVDNWLLERLIAEEKLSGDDLEGVGMPLMTCMENAKIALSGGERKYDITQLNDQTGTLISHAFTRDDLADIFRKKEFYRIIAATIDRALGMAASKYNVKKDEIRGVFMVGGSSLLLGVRDMVRNAFPNAPVYCEQPFEAIARGACCYAGDGIPLPLVHDYCLKGWDRQVKEFKYVTVVPSGTNYPTDGHICAKYIASGVDNAETLGLVIYEKSEMALPGDGVIVGPDGEVSIDRSSVRKSDKIRPLNPEDREFLHAVPPCSSGQKGRFVAAFGIDQNKRLTLSLKDTDTGNGSYIVTRQNKKIPLPLKDYPLVKI